MTDTDVPAAPQQHPPAGDALPPGGAPPADRHERRRRATDEKIAAAVLEISLAQGSEAVTVNAVAARSGVAKTTIYRRYRNRLELLAAVREYVRAVPRDPELPTTRRGLTDLLRNATQVLEHRVGIRSIGALLASEEEFLRSVREQVLSPRVAAAQAYFERGVAVGTLREDVDYSLVVDLLFGGMIVRSAAHGGVDHRWSDAVVDLLWPLISRDGH